MKVNSTSDSEIFIRLQQLYENSKTTGFGSAKKPGQLHDTSPLMLKKANLLNSNRKKTDSPDASFYEKYSKIWLKPIFPVTSAKILRLTFSKFIQKQLGIAFRKLNLTETNPIAFTRCPVCDHIGLTLLTSSTQGQLSPRFMEKVKRILPQKKSCKIPAPNIPNRYDKKVSKENSPNVMRKSSENNSLVMYSEDLIASPERKVPMSDISEIQRNTYFFSPLSSPEQFQRSVRENRICKAKNEVSFEISRDSGDFYREHLKQPVPKLNFSELVYEKNTKKASLQFLAEFIKKREKFALEKIKIYQNEDCFTQERAKTQVFPQTKIPNFSVPTKVLSNTKKTAFKILNSRLEKFIYRRKMQGFYSISEIIYR